MALLVKFNQQFVRRPAGFVYQRLKQFSLDYRDALLDTGKKMRAKPIKSLFYTSSVCLLVYAYRTMPSLNSYKNDLIAFQQQQILTSNLIRNKQIETYLDTIEQLLARDQIHFVDCYLFSLIVYRNQHYSSDNGSAYKIYENRCSYLHLKRSARIIDIGMFNRWWILHRLLSRADIFDDISSPLTKKTTLS